MTTNVDLDKSFEGPSRFEGMFKHASKPSTANSFAGQTPTQGGGRWSAMRNHLIAKADEAASAKPFTVHPNSPRFMG